MVAHSELQKGQIVIARAWWRKPKGEPTRCRVTSVSAPKWDYADVSPLEGNPHARSVRSADILSIEEHHVC